MTNKLPQLRIPPREKYNGITLILDQASRIDRENNTLLSGRAGQWFNAECLNPDYYLWHCDIRTRFCTEPLLEGTKGIMLFGEKAAEQFGFGDSINQIRGTPLTISGVPLIATYAPQDCMDIVDHEGKNEADEDDGDDEYAKKDRASTSRRNYSFWARCDTQKFKRMLAGVPLQNTESPHILRPSTDEVLAALASAKDVTFMDIETHPHFGLNVLGLAVDDGPVYSIPLYDYATDTLNAGSLRILAAYAASTHRVRTVAHNGATFDYPYLIWLCGLPLGKNLWDTLITQHRLFPESEKSLAHCISMWTDFPYHKDEALYNPKTYGEETRLLKYNARDVDRMRLIYRAQLQYASTDRGMLASVTQGNAEIYPLICAELTGIRVDFEKIRTYVTSGSAYSKQLIRCIRLLVGYDLNPGSSKQLGEYFYSRLGIKPTRYTEGGAPKCDAAAITQLALSNPKNPVPSFVLRCKKVDKQTSSLAGTKFVNYDVSN